MTRNEREQLNRISRSAYNVSQIIEKLKRMNRDLLDIDLGDIQTQLDCMQEDIKYFYSSLA